MISIAWVSIPIPYPAGEFPLLWIIIGGLTVAAIGPYLAVSCSVNVMNRWKEEPLSKTLTALAMAVCVWPIVWWIWFVDERR